MRTRKPIAERFWPKVQIESKDQCWPWKGALKGKGYGAIGAGGDKGRPLNAHRVSWEIHFGKIPSNLHVLHKCDVACCVNPGHLFLGTNRDNVNDMVKKGRQTIGERNPMAKLTAEEVKEIRDLASVGWTHQFIADNYGATRPNVTMIIGHKTWKSVA